MGRKTYKIETEIKVQMICVARCNVCPHDHVYLNLELFGETQRTKLLHPVFPIKTKDKFYFDKTFWSPQNEQELHKLMRESPVSIELRHLQSGSKDSILIAFRDSNSHELLIEDSQSRVKGIFTAERQIILTPSKHSCGQLPCVKFEIRSTISCTETPVMDNLMSNDMDLCPHCDQYYLKKSHVSAGGCHIRSHNDMFSCDCELHRGTKNESFHCSVCHHDRALPLCIKCSQRYTSMHNEDYQHNIIDFEDEKTDDGPGKMRPPFVVRKVSSDIVARKPDAYDSVYNSVMREQSQLRSSRKKKLHRLRSCSPKGDRHEKRSPSREKRPAVKTSEICYACTLPPDVTRISCDSCNLTHRGEPSYRSGDLVRPEPPMLRTYRETVDQKPIYPINEIKCPKCVRNKVKNSGHSCDDTLLISTRPIYKLDGYRDMAKYFTSHDSREY